MTSLLHKVDYVSGDAGKEVNHVMNVLKEIGYPGGKGKKLAAKDDAERPKLSVGLPYVRGLSDSIRRILKP